MSAEAAAALQTPESAPPPSTTPPAAQAPKAVSPEGDPASTEGTPPEGDQGSPGSDEIETGDATDPDLLAAFEKQDEAAAKKPERKPKADEKPKEGEQALKEGEEGSQDDKATDDLVNDKRLPAGFRKRLGEVNQELQRTREERDKIRQEIAEIKAQGGGDQKALAKAIEEKDSTIKELQAKIGTLKFEKSEEYKAKYEKPFFDAAQDAREIIESLEVNDVDGDGMMSTRPANWDTDFAEVYHLAKAGKLGAAYKIIDQKFGGAASEVKSHLSTLRRLATQSEKALQTEQTNWEANQEKARANEAAQAARANTLWEKVNADLKSKRPEWFQPAKDDDDGNKLLQEGYDLVDKYFSTRSKLPLEQNIQYEAIIANRAAAFPRMAAKVTALQSQIEELQSEIEELKSSGPGGGRRTGGDGGSGEDDGFINSQELGEVFK